MNLESQVVSLSLAKRLKGLGVRQESYFYHCDVYGKWIIGVKGDEHDFSAFTVAELGEMLPVHHTQKNTGKGWVTWAHYPTHNSIQTQFHEASTEADARAKMLIYLLEKGLVKP